MLNYAAHGSTDNMTREEALDAFMGALNEATQPHTPQDRGPPLRQNSSRPHMPAPPQLAPSTSNALETPGRGRSSSCASDAEGGSSPKGPRPTIGVPSKPGQRLSIGLSDSLRGVKKSNVLPLAAGEDAGMANGPSMARRASEAADTYMDTVARTQIRDMLYYAVFVLVFTFALLFNRNDQRIFHFTHNLEEHLLHTEMEFSAAHVEKTYFDISSVEEWFQYMRGPFMAVVYRAASFDGFSEFPVANTNASVPYTSTTYGAVLNQRGSIIGQGRIVGGIRLGQVRTMSTAVECPTPPAFQQADPSWVCFEETYNSPPVGAREFGYPNIITGLTWWDDGGGLGEEPRVLSPTTSVEYEHPNVFTVLPNPHGPNAADEADAILANLQENRFVDLRTRAVFVDFTIYNPMLDFSCVIRMAGELPDSGGVMPLKRFITVRLYRDYKFGDYIRILAEALVLLMVIRYSVLELISMFRNGVRRHLAKLGNIAHILNLCLFFVSTGYRVWSVIELPDDVDPDSNTFVNFRTAADKLKTATDINAFNAFLTWVKVFKYLEFIPKLKILLGTLGNAAGKVSGFSFITAVVLFGSSQAFTLAFGTSLEAYRNLTQSFFSLTRVLFGDFDFEALRMESPFMGPLMFFSFSMLGVFILLNMFIAIISDAFAETKAELDELEDVGVDTIGKAVTRIVLNDGLYRIPWFGRKLQHVVEGAERHLAKMANNFGVMDLLALADKDQDGTLTAAEVADRLDTDGDGVIEVAEFIASLVEVGTSPADARRIAELIDANHDGMVSTAELSNLIQAQETLRQEQANSPDAPPDNKAAAYAPGAPPSHPDDETTPGSPRVAFGGGSAQGGGDGQQLSPVQEGSTPHTTPRMRDEDMKKISSALAHTKIRIALNRHGHSAVLSHLGDDAASLAGGSVATLKSPMKSPHKPYFPMSPHLPKHRSAQFENNQHFRELHAVIQRQAVTINHLNAKVDVLLSTLGCSPPPRPRPSGFGSGFVGGAGFGSRLSNVGPAGYSFRSQFK